MSSWLGALIFFGVAVGCSTKAPECDLSAELHARAGSAVTECGHAVLGSDAKPVDDCVVSSFNTNSAFVAEYDRHGTDSKVVFGLAGDGIGNVTFLLWDADPSGGSGAHSVITADSCTDPAVDASPSRDPFVTPPLNCTSMTSLGRVCD